MSVTATTADTDNGICVIPRYIIARPNVNIFVAFDIRVCGTTIAGAILRVN